MPISQAVVDLLDGRLQASEVVKRLMARDPRDESV
jgi:glycerol-3-phosphate dehydrogenase (NAD(P)+)